MLMLYKIIVNLAYVVLKPIFALKRKGAKEEWDHRLVLKTENYLSSSSISGPGQPRPGLCLFHASSLGEVRVLERLVGAVKAFKPDLKYCISTYTATGQKLAREIFPDAAAVFFFPLDCYYPLKRFFSWFNPDGIIMVETELWPYFLDFCRRREIPLVLANGRLTEKSTKYYRLFRSALEPLMSVYKKFIMQTDGDGRRIMEIGANSERIIVLGNIKYDHNTEINSEAQRVKVRKGLGISDDQILLVGASTRPGEEEILCHALKKVTAVADNLKVLLAPRHLDRLGEVVKILETEGFDYTLYSDLKTGSPPCTPIILMDKIGLLSGIFYGADLSFVGGTLTDLGGHNIMEPVLAGVPVLFGPSVYNVKDAADRVIGKKQGMVVNNTNELASAIEQFARGKLNFEKIETMGPSVAELTAQIIIEELGL